MYSDFEEEYENEYEFENESEFTYDDFLDFYKDDILYMLEEIKSRFTCSPFFISYVTLPILSDYIMKYVFTNEGKGTFTDDVVRQQGTFTDDVVRQQGTFTDDVVRQQGIIIDRFHTYYKQELEISYHIIYNFLKRFKIILQYNSWLYFCYTHTDLYEIENYNYCD